MRRTLLVLFLLSPLLVSAREVDNYLAWGVDLQDSGPAIDEYMRSKLREALPAINERKYDIPPAGPGSIVEAEVAGWYDSCYDVAHVLLREAFYSPTYQQIEQYIDEGNGLDIYPRRPSTDDEELRAERGETPENGFMTDDEYLDFSIVETSPMNVPLSRVVNVYGIYTGADKFGHATSFGVRYLRKFVELMEGGMSPEDAFAEVMDGGYKSEESIVGMMFTKVFSRADLEGNFQGMVFAWNLCQEDSQLKLVSNGETWELENLDSLSVRPYVNPNWDESFNNSIFTDEKWEESVTPTFEARNDCDKLESAWVRRQRHFYASIDEESASERYGGEWIPENFEGQVASDHSLDSYCETQTVASTAYDPNEMSPAESGNPLPVTEDEWRFTIAFPMIWAPDIDGKIRGGQNVDFTIPFDAILDGLSFGMMFELYANRGPYGLAFRSNFMRVEDENSRDGLINTQVETTLDMGVNDLLASFRVHDKVRLVTGVRHVLAKLDLDVTTTIGNNDPVKNKIKVTDDNMYDLLVGINFNHWFSDKWGIMLNSDLGVVGDNDRNFSTEFRALYRLGSLNNFWFGYRVLTIGSDSVTDGVKYKMDMTQHGPTLGWAFTF